MNDVSLDCKKYTKISPETMGKLASSKVIISNLQTIDWFILNKNDKDFNKWQVTDHSS